MKKLILYTLCMLVAVSAHAQTYLYPRGPAETGQVWWDQNFYWNAPGHSLGLQYDSSNFGQFTIDSNGNLAVDLTGTNPLTTFVDGIAVPWIGTPTIQTHQDVMRTHMSSGKIHGGALSVGDAETIDIVAGYGFIRSTDDHIGPLFPFDWDAVDELAIPTDTYQWVGMEYNGGVPQAFITTNYSDFNFHTNFPMGTVANEATVIHVHTSPFGVDNVAAHALNRAHGLDPIARDVISGGLILGESGDANRYVTMSAGKLWNYLNEFTISAVDTSGADTFDSYYVTTGTWTKTFGVSAWPFTQYNDPALGLVTMTNNRYANLWFYIELDGDLILVYGINEYTSVARAAEESVPSTLPDIVANDSDLLGRIIFQKSTTPAEQVDSAYDVTLHTTGVTDHGNLAGLGDDDHTQYMLHTYEIGIGDLDTDMSDMHTFYNGTFLETHDITVTSDGITVTLAIEKDGGGDTRVVFSDGIYVWDTTPADSIALTPGTDVSPQINYVYFLQSTKTLTVSTTAFPTTEFAAVATVVVQSAASVQADSTVYKMHAWTDHSSHTNGQGHLTELNNWVRHQHATWSSGVTISTSVGAATFDIATSSGIVLQLHDHTYPAFNTATGSEVMIVNDSVTAYNRVGNLTGELTDADGNTLVNKYYNLIVWGVISEDSGDCQLMINLPHGSYNTSSFAVVDADQTADYAIPTDFTGTGFLIARLTMRNVAGGNTFSEVQITDLRGLEGISTVGSVLNAKNEYDDNVFRIFNNTDNTKEAKFDASGITTATTRTYTFPDANITFLNRAAAETVTGLWNFSNDLSTANKLIHTGDTDTYLSFGTNEFNLFSGGSRIYRGTVGAAVVNENGADINFRVESDSITNAFFLDGANGRGGFGTGAPATTLEVENGTTDGVLVTFDQDDTNEAFINFEGLVGPIAASNITDNATLGSVIYQLKVEVNGTVGLIAVRAFP